MPLPSVINGAKRCQVFTKRTKTRCKNPAAFGCTSCRMHGAHKSKNVLSGAKHPSYKHGQKTKEARLRHQFAATLLLTLRDIGDHINMFKGAHSRGRKPKGYKKFDLGQSDEAVAAVLKILKKN